MRALTLLLLVSIASARRGVAQVVVPFRPGEVATYHVEFSGIGVGSGSIRVDSGPNIDGAATWILRFAVRGGIPFFRVNDVLESWYDPARQVSVRFAQELHEGPKRYSRLFEMPLGTGQFIERGKPPSPSVADPLDDAAFLFFVRTQPLEVGRRYEWDRHFRPDANPIRVTVERRERIRVPAGEFDALVLRPSFRSRGVFGEGGRAELWVADDSTRRVLQMKSRLSFGSLNLFLTGYQPGR